MKTSALRILLCSVMLMLGAGLAAVEEALACDKYGGLLAAKGTPGAMFHMEKIGNRWWFVTPDGHGMFVRTVSKVNSHSNMDWGGSGGYLSYDAVYLQSADGKFSENLKAQAENTLRHDLLLAGTDYTLKNVGDAIYIGSERLRPNFMYFWMGRLGQGGRMQWQYSTAEGWRAINETGNPSKGIALAEDGSFNLDCGNYIAPNEDGAGKSGDKTANKITFWELTKGYPADFAAAALPHDKTPRYWIKGVVSKQFATAPVLNQTFERAEFDDTARRKYGPGADYNKKWAEAIGQRLKGWGMNAVGMYSYRYNELASQLSLRLPTEETWQISGDVMKAPHLVKNMYAGAVFPPGSDKRIWAAKHADPFDANYRKSMLARAATLLERVDPWIWMLIPEEADWLFGFNSVRHAHLGYIVIAHNPCRPEDQANGTKYSDTRFYAKYALRDFLRHRYKAPDEKLAEITTESVIPLYDYNEKSEDDELKALQRLNEAWGTKYTTWGTSAGSLADGSNAFGKGSGFMDENGAGILEPKARNTAYETSFTRKESPAIRQDLDDFVALAAARYGSILKAACDQKPRPPLFVPLYKGVDFAFKAIAPYVDGFWATPKNAEQAEAMYKLSQKPIVVADYTVGDPDSPSYFRCVIKEISFDPQSGNTVIHCPDLRYNFRSMLFIHFPEAEELNKTKRAGSKYVATTRPRVARARWNTLEIAGDYSGGVKAGMTVELIGGWMSGDEPFPPRTQEERAKLMIDVIDSTLMAKGEDACHFVVGWEHWCLYDDGVNNWAEIMNCGIATLHDNAYDGVEARRAVSKDARGNIAGGEEKDYGNLLGTLSTCLRRIDQRLLETK